MEAKKTKQQQQKQKNKSSWSLGVEAHLHLLAFFSPCSNSRQLQASTDDSYISIVLHFYLTLSFFHFCQLLLRNWRRVWCRLTVVGLGLYDFVPFFFPFFFLPPPISPQTHQCPITKSNQVVLQIFAEYQGCKQRHTDTQRIRLGSLGGFLTVCSPQDHKTGWGGERRRNHCWLNACEWFMAQRAERETEMW